MSFGDAIRTCFSKYATFSGRARRSEFWYFALLYAIVLIGGNVIGSVVKFSYLGSLFGLALIVPLYAVGARRLHDTGRSGWLWLLEFIPLVGVIILIVWWAGDTNQAGDKYGPSPKGVAGYPAYPPA